MLTVVEGTQEGGFVPLGVPDIADLGPSGNLGTREDIQAELDLVLAAMRDFWASEPDQVLRQVAAYTARLTELAVQLVRVEARDRTYKQLRTLQVERILAELERQQRIASRLIEQRRQDLNMAGMGGT